MILLLGLLAFHNFGNVFTEPKPEGEDEDDEIEDANGEVDGDEEE